MLNTLIKITLAILVFLSQQVFAKNYLVGFAQDTLANDWRLSQVMAVKAELEKHKNIQFVYTDGKGSTSLQASHIEDLVNNKKIDVLITSPREEDILSKVISNVFKKGIPVILLDRGIQGNHYSTFIRPDNRPIATAAANYLVKQMNARGHILMLEGIPGATPTIQRTKGFLKVMAQYPNIKITRRTANYLRSDAIVETETLLENNITFDAIYAQSDSMASGARMALAMKNIDPKNIIIVGIDYIKEAKKAILSGQQSVSFTYPTGGKEGAIAAVKILAGETVDKEQIIESIKVTKENANLVEPIF